MMTTVFINLSILFLVLTTLAHSIGGEIYLLRPLFKYRGNKVLENDLARLVLRFAWHLTSLMWLLLALLLYNAAYPLGPARDVLLLGVGWTFTAVGFFDLIASRGRHIGWPLLLGTGMFALMAHYLT